MKRLITIVIISSMAIWGCATRPHNIEPNYVSPTAYSDYSCDQLIAEMGRIKARLISMSKAQDREATKDAAALTVSALVFWPAMFFMIGDDKKEEIADLKGRYEALQQAVNMKDCGRGGV